MGGDGGRYGDGDGEGGREGKGNGRGTYGLSGSLVHSTAEFRVVHGGVCAAVEGLCCCVSVHFV